MALTKLTITAYKTEEYSESDKVGDFEVMLNPETYSREFSVNYNEKQAMGAPAATLNFNNIPSDTVTFQLIFDGTGLVDTMPASQKNQPVEAQIGKFKRLTLQYDGSIHQPNFLQLLWGKFRFKGVLTSLSIEYTLIDQDGKPLRAKANCTFKSSTSYTDAQKEAANESADMTHTRTVKAGSTLYNMSQSIYGDPNYYIQVAHHNNLDQFRQLKNGVQLDFPPLT